MMKDTIIIYWIEKADYRPLVQFDKDQVQEIIDQTSGFLKEMERLLSEDIVAPGK